jgi:RHS repeat-associated protein
MRSKRSSRIVCANIQFYDLIFIFMRKLIRLAFLFLTFAPVVSFGFSGRVKDPEFMRRIEAWGPDSVINLNHRDGVSYRWIIRSIEIDDNGMRLELDPAGGQGSPPVDGRTEISVTPLPDGPSISQTDGDGPRNSQSHGAKSGQGNNKAGQNGTSSPSTGQSNVGAGEGVIQGFADVAVVIVEESDASKEIKKIHEDNGQKKRDIAAIQEKMQKDYLEREQRAREAREKVREARKAFEGGDPNQWRAPDKNSIVKSSLIAPGSGYVEPVLRPMKSVPAGYTSQPIEKNDVQCGSIILVDSLSLGETIPLGGTPFSLVYFSDRVIGRRGDYQVEIPAQQDQRDQRDQQNQQDQKSNVRSVLTINLAGRSNSVAISSSPFGFELAWDGSDSQGNQVWSKAKAELTLNKPSKSWTTFVGNFKPAYLGIGGWGLNAIHYLSIEEGIIYLGNGQTREVKDALATFSDRIEFPSADGLEVYAFDSKGLHRETRHGLTGGVLWTFSYDEDGKILSVTDSFRNTTSFVRTKGSKLIRVIAPYGQETELTLDNDGYLARAASSRDEIFRMGYLSGGLMSEFQKPNGKVNRFNYDSMGYLLRDDSAGGAALRFKGSLSGASGSPIDINMTTAEGRKTDYLLSRSGDGFYERRKTFPDGTTSVMRYKSGKSETLTTPDFELKTEFQPDIRFKEKLSIPTRTQLKFNELAEFPIEVNSSQELTGSLSPFDFSSLTTRLMINGKVFTEVFDRASNQTVLTSPMGRITSFQIDDFGNRINEQVGQLEPTKYSYDQRGRLFGISRGKKKTEFQYDNQGLLESIVDPLLRKVRYSYDEAHRLKSETLPDGRSIGYQYDPNGNLISVTPPSRPAHQFKFNLLDLVSSYLAPSLQQEGVTETRYSYNRDKQLIGIAFPGGEQIAIKYGQKSGRLEQVVTNRGSYAYTYNSSGLLEKIVSPDDIAIDFAYFGSLPRSQSTKAFGNENSLEFGYNKDLKVKSLRFRSGRGSSSSSARSSNSGSISKSGHSSHEINYGYDDDGLLTQAGEMTIGLDPDTGSVVSSKLGKVKETYGYDQEYGELKMMALSFNEQDLYQETFTRDELGRITNKKISPAGKKPSEFSYSYNPAGQLSTVHKDNELVSKYEYDFNGNPISKIRNGQSLASSYDSQDRLTSDSIRDYAYNPRGQLRLVTEKDKSDLTNGSNGSNGVNGPNANNLARERQTQLSYDLVGNLLSVTLPDGKAIEYLTDGLNRRVAKKINGQLTEQYLYQSQLQIAALIDPNGHLVSRFVYGTKANVPEYMIKADRKYKIFSDHLGSPNLVIDTETGAIAQQIEYDEFGAVLSDSNPGFQPFGFAGGLYDRDTGLVRFGARDYDPQVGRWTSKDPIGFEGGDTNLYGYVLNDPINMIDPNGESPLLVGAVIGAFVGTLLTPTPMETPITPLGEIGRVSVGATAGAIVGGAVGVAGAVAIAPNANRYIRIGEGKFPEPYSQRISIGNTPGKKIEIGKSPSGRIDFKFGKNRTTIRPGNKNKCE